MQDNTCTFELLRKIVNDNDNLISNTENINEKSLKLQNSMSKLTTNKPNMLIGKECAPIIVKLKANADSIYNSNIQIDQNEDFLSHNVLNKLQNNILKLRNHVEEIKAFNNEIEFVREHVKKNNCKSDLEMSSSVGLEDAIASTRINSTDNTDNISDVEPIVWT